MPILARKCLKFLFSHCALGAQPLRTRTWSLRIVKQRMHIHYAMVAQWVRSGCTAVVYMLSTYARVFFLMYSHETILSLTQSPFLKLTHWKQNASVRLQHQTTEPYITPYTCIKNYNLLLLFWLNLKIVTNKYIIYY